MGMRLNEGLSLEAVSAAALNRRAIKRLREQGLLHPAPDRLRATSAGRLVLNSLIAEIVADSSKPSCQIRTAQAIQS